MKKTLLLLILTVFLTACSSDDDGGSSSNSSINPPEWIQGTWLTIYSNDPLIAGPGYRFLSNDFCYVNGSTVTCQAEIIELGGLNVEEIITDTEYELKIGSTSSTTFNFIKINDTTIEFVSPISELLNITYTKQ